MGCRELNITNFFIFYENKNIDLYFPQEKINAYYEYSPFGKITKTSGTLANDFEFRFSSEVFDKETGLVYYNYRYYSPELGRWLSRDPIGESGGNNLYGMVNNNILTLFDMLGLWPGTIICTRDTTPAVDTGWFFVSAGPDSTFSPGASSGGATSSGFVLYYARTITTTYTCKCCLPTTPSTKTRTQNYIHTVNVNRAILWNSGIPGTWPPLNLWDYLGGVIGGLINPPSAYSRKEQRIIDGEAVNNLPATSVLPIPSNDSGIPTKWCLWK